MIGVFKRMLDLAEIDADVTSLTAEQGLQDVLDRLRAGGFTRHQLASLARAITIALDETTGAIATASADEQEARDQVARWLELVATAERHGRDDLAAQARGRLAHHRDGERAAAAVVFEHRHLEAQLREVGRLVLERARQLA